METFKCDYIQTYGMTETSPYLTLSILKDRLTHLSDEEQFVYKAKTGRPFMGVLLKVVRKNEKSSFCYVKREYRIVPCSKGEKVEIMMIINT